MTTPMDVELQVLAQCVGRRLAVEGATLVTAESCTGGWIAKACTDVAGSSQWFLGGIVAYSNALKSSLLGLPEEVLAEHGAVSEPVVRAMAEAALHCTPGSVAIAVSGVAGPTGGTPDKPVGTVWLAWAWRQRNGSLQVESRRVQLAGGREDVRRHTVQCALERLLTD